MPIASRLKSESDDKLNIFTKKIFIILFVVSLLILIINNLLIDNLISMFAYDFSKESVLITKKYVENYFF